MHRHSKNGYFNRYFIRKSQERAYKKTFSFNLYASSSENIFAKDNFKKNKAYKSHHFSSFICSAAQKSSISSIILFTIFKNMHINIPKQSLLYAQFLKKAFFQHHKQKKSRQGLPDEILKRSKLWTAVSTSPLSISEYSKAADPEAVQVVQREGRERS